MRVRALVRWWPRLFRGKSIEANSSKSNSVIGIGRIGAREISVCLFYNHQSIQHSRLFRDEPKLLAYFLQSPRHTQGVCWHPTLARCGLRSMPRRDKFPLSLPTEIIFYA